MRLGISGLLDVDDPESWEAVGTYRQQRVEWKRSVRYVSCCEKDTRRVNGDKTIAFQAFIGGSVTVTNQLN
jgi:hypothetical protein